MPTPLPAHIMGFFFTLLYIVTAFLTPSALFGPLAEYHVQFVVVGLAVVFSIPNLGQSGVMKTRQAFAVLAFSFVVFLSVALTGWLGGAAGAVYGFLQNELAFFLVAINFRKKQHFQILAVSLILGSTWFILLGMRDLHDQVMNSTYLYGEGAVRRIRGLGFVNDPNDLAQVLVSLIPTVFLWKRRSLLPNIFLMGVPLSILLWGMYLTHSRGAILALTAVVLVSGRRKIGTVPASVVAGLLLAGGLAAGWSGGRDVSMDGGADRLDLWAAGLDIIKAHPLFGVGIGGFADANGVTAHNSVVICASETGIVGLFFWTMLLFCSFREGVLFDRAANQALAEDANKTDLPIPVQTSLLQDRLGTKPFTLQRNLGLSRLFAWTTPHSSAAVSPHRGPPSREPNVALSAANQTLRNGQSPMHRGSALQVKELSVAEVSGLIRILIVSLTGFLTAGWFLSRAVSMWLFMYCGMLYAATHMAAEIGVVRSKDSISFTLRWTFAVTLSLIVLLSVILRLRYFGR